MRNGGSFTNFAAQHFSWAMLFNRYRDLLSGFIYTVIVLMNRVSKKNLLTVATRNSSWVATFAILLQIHVILAFF